MRLPQRRCTHAYGMIFEDDYCVCKHPHCEQEWTMTSKGWRPLVDGRVFEPQFRPKKGSFRKGGKNVQSSGVKKIRRRRR